jgi:glycosyltransferase involved in cell wall biosynthesis
MGPKTMKVAVCYNADIRDNGTAFYVRRALERRTDIETVFVRSPSPDPPRCDLYVAVDDGRDDIDWICPRPNVFWAIDTHLGPEFRRWKAERFDRVYTAQKDAAELWKQQGIAASWLPLACDPEYHPNAAELAAEGYDTWPLYDVAFVGHIPQVEDGNDRVEYLDAVFRAIPKCWFACGVFHREMALRYVRGRCGFNVSVKRDLNMRVFEVMCTGTPLVTNRDVVGLEELFAEGVHFCGYEGTDEAVEAVERVIADEALAGRMAREAEQEVRARHRYDHRVARILEET